MLPTDNYKMGGKIYEHTEHKHNARIFAMLLYNKDSNLNDKVGELY